MHLYMLTRGKSNFVRRFKEDLEANFLPYNLNGVAHNLQVVMRPVQLWEVAFPEAQKDAILSLIGDDPLNQTTEDGGRAGPNAWIKWLIGKVVEKLGLKKIPEKWNQVKQQLPRINVAVHLVGLKEDFKEPVVNERT